MPAGTVAWENLKEKILLDIGGEIVDIELTPESLDNNIDETLSEFRATASPASKEGYQFLTITDNERFYPLDSNIIDVTDIQRIGAGVVSGIEGLQYGAFIYQAMENQQSFDLVSFHLVEAFIETLNRMTASDPAYIFHSSLGGQQVGYTALDPATEVGNVGDTLASGTTEFDNLARLNGPVLELLNLPKTEDEEVYLLNVRYSRSDAELINDMDTGIWIRRYARACAKITLGIAYRKFDGAPSAGGSLSLPGNDLVQEGKEEQVELKQDLLDLKYGEETFSFLMG